MYRQDDPIYSHDPMKEEMMIELNGEADYWAELAALEGLGEEEAEMDDFRDEEEWAGREDYDEAVLDLSEDIPF